MLLATCMFVFVEKYRVGLLTLENSKNLHVNASKISSYYYYGVLTLAQGHSRPHR